MSSSGPPVPFSSLPLSKADSSTKLNAWGAYGPTDELGFLNRQTDEIVAAAAASEIKTGIRVSLNAPLDFQGDTPLFGRQTFKKDVYQKKPRIVHDDTWHFNTQSASQWDGLRHFAYQTAQRFYNDTTLDDIAGTTPKSNTQPNILGIQNMQHRGIVGRGILLDFVRWREAVLSASASASGASYNDALNVSSADLELLKSYNSFTRSPIKLPWLHAILAYQNTTPRYGDILLTRTGFHKAYPLLSPSDITHLQSQSPPHLAGIEQSEPLLKWIWDTFSAVGGDQPSFEQWPTPLEWSCHEVLLAGWGCPIGELFDLEELGRVCERKGRWSFFFTSEVVYVPGGVASPPNALAIF